MGLGKTAVTLSALNELIYDRFETARTLIIAPKRVAESTWEQEAEKWQCFENLTFSRVLGSAKQRESALEKDADIYIINRENVPWLVTQEHRSWRFDTVVIDELSSFRNPSSQRFRALKRVLPKIKRVIGLTGTPAPKGLIDLWAQIYLLDSGERLGRTVGEYRRRYFTPGRRNGYVVYEWLPLKHSAREIYEKLSDICVSMKSADYLNIPKRTNVIRRVKMPENAALEYKKLEREGVLMLKGDNAVSGKQGALFVKLSQYANGAVYGDNGEVLEIHEEKLNELERIIEEANGNSVLVFYTFKHDAARIESRFGNRVRRLTSPEDIRDWNEGKIEILLAHPASCGHGLNLQSGGSALCWYSLTYSLELYQQTIARLWRQGQEANTVVVKHIIAENTIDGMILKALKAKDGTQSALIDAVKAILI